jgi:hypothetical protein
VSPVWPLGDPRDVARVILAGPRYRGAAQSAAGRTWWDLVREFLGRLWDRLVAPLHGIFGNDAATSTIGIVVLAAVLIALAVVVVRFARRVRFRRTSAALAEATALHEEGDATTLRARALAAAAEGRYHDAAVLLWGSALHALDERGRIRYDPSRSPAEWRRAVRDPAFDAFARDAVVALFARHAVDAALVERMRAAYERIVVLA